jgi:hypothetical protein
LLRLHDVEREAGRLIVKIGRFGVLGKGEQADAFERRVVQALQADDRCKLAWRTATAAALTELVDFIIDLSERGAGERLAGQVLHGVWFASVGEDRRLDLKPALLGNFLDPSFSVPVTVARWKVDGAGAETLVRWNMRSRRTSGRHVDASLAGIAECFAAALKRIESGALPTEHSFKPGINGRPVSLLRLLMVNARNVLDLTSASFTLDMWNVGVYEGGSPRDVFDPSFMKNIRWLPPEEGWRYRADPFGFRRPDGESVVFHEAYDYRTGKGVIARIVGDLISIAGEFPAHAAYPYLFEHNGRRYCMPEQSESGGVTVFAVDEASLDLVKGRPQLPDVPLVDGTVFPFGGLHWLFGTRADNNYNARLYAWYAETPFGPWTAHACNPIKVDIAGARSAGTPFVFNGSLIRPAQDCSRTYGGAVVLNRVSELTPTRFAEEPIGRIEPDPRSPYRDGVHTLCVSDGLVLVDGKYRRWYWLAPLLRITLDRASARRRRMMAGQALSGTR